jgi:integrase
VTAAVRNPNKKPATCIRCFAWGVHDGRACKACTQFARQHAEGECAGCRRPMPLKKSYCRLCWAHASLEATGQVTVLAPYLQALSHHQLFFADMRRAMMRRGNPPCRSYSRPVSPPLPPQPFPPGVQLSILDSRRDLRQFDRSQHADLANPWLAVGRKAASDIAELHGWSASVRTEVDRGMVIVLSGHTDGNRIRYSEVAQLHSRGLPVDHAAEVIDRLGLLDDDRPSSFEAWLERNLADLAPGIARDVEAWLRMLREGGPRAKPHSKHTVWAYFGVVRPVLEGWSAHSHLREITRDDVIAATEVLQGWRRSSTLTALRSLFQHCRRRGAIFRDPTSRIRVGRHADGVTTPLQRHHVDEAVTAATNAELRLVLALAAVHAARPGTIRNLCLEDVDYGNRRLTIGGRTRPLDDLTRQALIDYLAYRRDRWPDTANPHVIITQHTTYETGPISSSRFGKAFFGLKASPDRLRIDRQLEEALVHGPDPLHLATVFGVSEKTAIRYAAAARQLLATPIEQPHPGLRE